jgi:ParB family chromosome partitioning protein
MKRAPIIPKVVNNLGGNHRDATPAAPMVDSLIARVGAMAKGNCIALPVCGREVKFTLESIAASEIESATSVWVGNERDQDLLTEEALEDLLPSFMISGQQNPAFARRINVLIEVADGSRRRKAAIITSSEYRVLVGELDDEQMETLSKLGNDYRPTSAYERGKRYSRRLDNEFKGNISALSELENISRKIITRCINTSLLPKEVLSLFGHPGELSARAGDALYKEYSEKMDILVEMTKELANRKSIGTIFEADEIIEYFKTSRLKANPKAEPTKRQFAPGASAQYKGNKITISLDTKKLSASVIDKIETILLNI